MVRNKIILTDCDGVLLDFAGSFKTWAESEHGLNEINPNAYSFSDRFGVSHGEELTEDFIKHIHWNDIDVMPKSVKPIQLLHELFKIKLVVVSAIDESITKARTANLKKFYGDAICEVHCVGTSAYKKQILQEYAHSGALWIEDWIANANVGTTLGLNSVVHNQPWNLEEKTLLPRFNDMSGVATHWLTHVRIQED